MVGSQEREPSVAARWYPSTTFAPARSAAASLTVVVALLSAGLYLGAWAFDVLPAGRDWFARVVACEQRTQGLGLGLERATVVQACAASVGSRLASAELIGAATVALLALAAALVVPVRLRRRYRLRVADDRFAPAAARFGVLAQEAGVPRARLEIGDPRQGDAFVYGLVRVALPRALAVRARSTELFDPVVRHELVHARHRDAVWVWVVAGGWWVLAVLLAVPAAWVVVDGDASVLAAYLWRAAVLVAAAFVAARALVRAREHDADLDSVRTPRERAALRALLARQATGRPGRPARPSWLALHPSAAQRVEALDRPDRASRLTFLDAAAPAFFGMLALELARGLLLDRTSTASVAVAWTAVGLGALLGVALGLACWRDTVLRRAAGARASVVPPAAGVFVGVVAGGLCSLGRTTAGGTTIVGLVLTALGVTGALVLTRGFAELVGDAAPRVPRVGCWLVVVATSCVAFSTALWAGGTLDAELALGGRWLALMAVGTLLETTTPAASLALLAVVAGVLTAARRPAGAPAWTRDLEVAPAPVAVAWPARTRPRLPALGAIGLAAGLGCTLAVGLDRAVAGRATAQSAEQRFAVQTWAFALAAVGAVLVAVAAHRADTAAALVAGFVAVAVCVVGFVVLNVALGGVLTGDFVRVASRSAGGIAMVLLLAALPAALATPAGRAPGPQPGPHAGVDALRGRARRSAAALAVAVAVTGLLAAAAFVGRDSLYPATTSAADAVEARAAVETVRGLVDASLRQVPPAVPPAPSPAVAPSVAPGSSPTSPGGAASAAHLQYVDVVAPQIVRTLVALDGATASATQAAQDGPTRAATLQAGPLAAAQQLRDLSGSDGAGLTSPTLEVAHAREVQAADDLVSALAAWSTGLHFSDVALQGRAQSAYATAWAEWQQWQALVSTGGVAPQP